MSKDLHHKDQSKCSLDEKEKSTLRTGNMNICIGMKKWKQRGVFIKLHLNYNQLELKIIYII